MRTLDLLRNHPWNMQALIQRTDEGDFLVQFEPIVGEGMEKRVYFDTEEDARRHAKLVLGFDD